ncbi:MAG: hypothetical protein NUV34_02885 [Sulfuricaulis sp.]|nr:hypothetical protein [Sulfuricaulis sp.]
MTDPNWIFYPIPDYQAGGGTGRRRAAPRWLRRSRPVATMFFLTPVSILALS